MSIVLSNFIQVTQGPRNKPIPPMISKVYEVFGISISAKQIVIMVVTAVVGIIAAIIGGPDAGEMAGVVVSAALNAVMALYFVAIIAATHRQLAGEPAETTRATFE